MVSFWKCFKIQQALGDNGSVVEFKIHQFILFAHFKTSERLTETCLKNEMKLAAFSKRQTQSCTTRILKLEFLYKVYLKKIITLQKLEQILMLYHFL